jgi:flavin reductase (DIM6/NTAB) family NADH-FMN oxidoreductase RutF
MHTKINPAILYWGSIVVLITTENEDGTSNIAPMSSAWWLGHRCMLGLDASSKTTTNLLRTKQCVLNLPSDAMGEFINALSHTTGTEIVPPSKESRGYRHVKDKFGISGLTPVPSDLVVPPCIKEVPIQMEAKLMDVHSLMKDVPSLAGALLAIEVEILRVYVEESLKMEGYENRVDADKWRPMVMSLQEMYGLKDEKAVSKLATIDQEMYRPLAKIDADTKEMSDGGNGIENSA